jgi:hypothetical protein
MTDAELVEQALRNVVEEAGLIGYWFDKVANEIERLRKINETVSPPRANMFPTEMPAPVSNAPVSTGVGHQKAGT